MASRWRVLIAIALTVAVLDQWSKYMAVAHLTNGIQLAAAGGGPQGDLSFLERVGVFYGSVREPCKKSGSICPTVEVVPGFWNWRYVENPGAAWGLFSTANEGLRVPFFFVVSIAAMAFIVMYVRKLAEGQKLLLIALSLVFGGAIGNFIDRLHLSYVIDFIDWYAGTYHWPTFNVADAAISSGVGLLIVDMLLTKQPAAAESPATE